MFVCTCVCVCVCACVRVCVCMCVCVNELKFILCMCERLAIEYCLVYLDCDVLTVVNGLPNISNGFKGGIREDSDIGANIRYC